MGLALWSKNISYKEMNELISIYLGINNAKHIKWEKEFRRFILLKIKEISTNAFGLGYFVPRSKSYYKGRIIELNKLYEESFIRGSI